MCCVLLLFLACSVGETVYSREKQDVILVLDTSMSMIGYGGRNIMSDVKKSVYTYIDNLEDGDRVTFIIFDSDVRIYPTVLLDDANDRDIIKKYISVTPVEGKWTHTNLMLDRVFNQAEELQKDGQDRQLVIVVMTDGIDDPPPAANDKMNIADIASKYEGKDWWIFLVDYQSLKEAQQNRDKLKGDLSKVGTTYIVDGSGAPDDAMNQVIAQEKSNHAFPIALLVAIIVILLVLAIIYYMKRQAQLKVRGTFEYWNNDMIKPYLEKFEMTKYQLKEIQIGNQHGSQLRLREFESKEPFRVLAVRNKKNEIKVQLKLGTATSVEFINGERKEFLESGDTFRIANYSFRYLP